MNPLSIRMMNNHIDVNVIQQLNIMKVKSYDLVIVYCLKVVQEKRIYHLLLR